MAHVTIPGPAVLLVLYTVFSGLASADELMYPMQIEWQQPLAEGYSDSGFLDVEDVTLAKTYACQDAYGDDKFCHCLASTLPVGLTFDGYIQAVTKSRLAIGYDDFSESEKKMVDMAGAVRDQCTSGRPTLSALSRKQAASADARSSARSIRQEGETPGMAAHRPGGYLVQLASFKNPQDAENLRSKLESRGMNAHTQAVELPKRGLWHRVYMGPFKRDEARQIMDQLQEQFQVSAWLMPNGS